MRTGLFIILKVITIRTSYWNSAEKIADILQSLLAIERIGGGIGILEIDQDEELDFNRLSKKILIVSEKAIGLNDTEIGICYYDKEIETQISREEDIKRELSIIASEADDGCFYLQYQPIYDLKANRICEFEALARMKNHKAWPGIAFGIHSDFRKNQTDYSGRSKNHISVISLPE